MEFLKRMNIWQKRGIASIIGGLAGYSYYFYIGCVSGTCAITSNPYISTAYGAIIAALFINKSNTDQKARIDGNSSSAAK